MRIQVTKALFSGLIEPGQILFFKNPEFPEKPHPHILLADKNNEVVLMACGTNQQGTVERFIYYNDLPSDSVVWVNPQPENGLTKETYINCNESPFEFSRDELLEMYNDGELKIIGRLSNTHFEQVLLGFVNSDLIETWVQELLQPLLD